MLLLNLSFLALSISALPHIKRDDDDDQNRGTTGLVAGTTLTSARATSVITSAVANPARPTAPVIATVDGPVPSSAPNGLYQCGEAGDGLGRYYQSTKYTCFDGDILCPRLAGGLRTRPCGDACYNPEIYSCGDDNQLRDVPCAQSDDCEPIEFENVDTEMNSNDNDNDNSNDDNNDDSNDDDDNDD